jgi:hypothetical protein
VNGVTLGSDYEDDMALIFGEYRVYVVRHLLFTHNQAASVFTRDLEEHRMPCPVFQGKTLETLQAAN